MTNELLEFLMEDSQFVDIMTPEFNSVNEGSYSEAMKFGSSELAKEYDTHLNAGKSAKKNKEYKLAIKEFKECKKLIPKLNNAANKISDDNGWDKFLGFISTSGVNLTKQFKDKTTGNRAYYRIWWKQWIKGATEFLDKQITECEAKM